MKLKIMGTDMAVINMPDLQDAGVKLDGALRTSSDTLFLDEDLGLQARVVTILHEVIHAYIIKTGNNHLIDPIHHEMIAEGLSNGLFQFIRDNPEFIESIYELDELDNPEAS